MINTEIINFLSEVDTNVFLFFNGIHSPFWDYFMSAFTGKLYGYRCTLPYYTYC